MIMLQWSKNNLTFLKKRQLFTLIVHTIRAKSIAIYFIAFLCLNICAPQLLIHENGLLASEKFGVKKVVKSKGNYFVLTKDGINKIHRHDVSQSLREMDDEQLTHFLNSGNGVLKINRFTNGEFKLDRHVRGNGGGFAGFWIGATLGKVVVSTVGYGTIGLISMAAGPGAPFAATAMTTLLAPYIEGASVYAAAVGGMALGAATGPV